MVVRRIFLTKNRAYVSMHPQRWNGFIMTIEELAKHWNVSLDEAKSISDFMNRTFYMTVGQKHDDKTFYGVIFERFKDGAVRPAFTLSADPNQGFKTEKEVIDALNKVLERIKIPEFRAKNIMGVPQDAFIALKRLGQTSIVATQKNIPVVLKGRGSRS